MSTLKALSIRGPWWWFILFAGKRLENRSWMVNNPLLRGWRGTRGPILIHASSGCTVREFEEACVFAHEVCGVRKYPEYSTMHRGGIVGKAVITDWVESSEDPWFMGPGALVLDQVETLPFQPCKGALGFFTPILTP